MADSLVDALNDTFKPIKQSSSPTRQLRPRRKISRIPPPTEKRVAAKPRSRIGAIRGIPVGSKWSSQKDCHRDGVHACRYAGIHGDAKRGAHSVVLSAGYEDDVDNGETFEYTGAGGRGRVRSFGGRYDQIEDQSFDHLHNKRLVASFKTKNPIRVIRGTNPSSPYAPSTGFRYDGLYTVTKCRLQEGQSGHMVCRFMFKRNPDQPPLPKRW